MVRSVLMALSCMSLGAVADCAIVVMMAWSAWMILSSVVMFGLGSLWCLNRMASLMMAARDALVSTR
jgi:hypothetical protein